MTPAQTVPWLVERVTAGARVRAVRQPRMQDTVFQLVTPEREGDTVQFLAQSLVWKAVRDGVLVATGDLREPIIEYTLATPSDTPEADAASQGALW